MFVQKSSEVLVVIGGEGFERSADIGMDVGAKGSKPFTAAEGSRRLFSK